jgi:predicted ABC-type ATPase
MVLVIGGPNGAGKTTISRRTIAERAGVAEFVNADAIALGLSAFDPDRAAMAAGRVMLERLRALAAMRASFAFESTLASRSFAPWLRGLVADGYDVHVTFVWLKSPQLAVRRVRSRFAHGGHFVPPDTVRRRYARACHNFVHMYAPLATTWRVYDNSFDEAEFVAYRMAHATPVVLKPRTYAAILRIADADAKDRREKDLRGEPED